MKKLIIINGISGTGKTTLANKLYNNIDSSTLISFDTLKENIYDIIGFKNIYEKDRLKSIVVDIYKSLVTEALDRGDSNVIVEYPFRKEWYNFFSDITTKYEYKVYTINLFCNDFDALFENLKIREGSNRHPGHYLDSYSLKKKDEYESRFEFNYSELKEIYNNYAHTHLSFGEVINIYDVRNLDIMELISNIG